MRAQFLNVLAVFAAGAAAQGVMIPPPIVNGTYLNFTTIKGLFMQDDPATNSGTFDYSKNNFGLINQSYPTDADYKHCVQNGTLWQRFIFYVKSLNRDAPPGTSYRLLFMGRHGEGYHNAAESYYGTPAWNCYYAELNGNATVTWADAHLTQNGVNQALIANAFWASQMVNQKQPPPQSYYTSPLTRCLDTANLTFTNLSLPADRPFHPTVKELFREGISIHTCDRRSNETYIHNRYPTWAIEAGFAQNDPLWNGTYAESSDSQNVRSRIVLDDVFRNDGSQIISITSHSGEIGSLLTVLGHQPFSLSTGQIITTLVRVDTIKVDPFPTTTMPWQSQYTCQGPPIASTTSGCVCASTTSPGLMSTTAM